MKHSNKPQRIPLVLKSGGESHYEFKCKCGWSVEGRFWTAQEAYENGADYSPTGVIKTYINGEEYVDSIDEDVSSKSELQKYAIELFIEHTKAYSQIGE